MCEPRLPNSFPKLGSDEESPLQDSVEELKQYVQVALDSAPHASPNAHESPSTFDVERLQLSVDQLAAREAAREAAMERLQSSVELLHRRLDKVLGPGA